MIFRFPFHDFRSIVAFPDPARVVTATIVTAAGVGAILLSGCGGTNSGNGNTSGNANTTVTLLASSSANDQLSQFSVVLNSLTLTGNSGKSVVSLIDTPLHVEFVHLNGSPEPILTVNVPQGTYTSATATIGVAQFACVNLNPAAGDGLEVSDFANPNVSGPSTTVSVTGPITIGGANMGLLLDLIVSQSATWTTCDPNGITPFSITPTFSLAPLQFSAAPTKAQNGFETGLEGMIASVNGSSFTVTAADGPSCNPPAGESCDPAAANGPSWQVAAAANAVFQGVKDASQLAVGMPVNMDVTIQPDGSLQASRIAVFDPNPANLSVYSGPLLAVTASEPALNSFGREEQGKLLVGGAAYFSFGQATFQIANQLTNLSRLPFTASFTAANMVAGQNVDITSHALVLAPGPTFVPATTITLRPQTLDGTISAVSSQGNFTAYTVALASYDPFPTFAVQPGQTTLLTQPASVVVYVDSDSQVLSSGTLSVGGVYRFTGLVFNDGGTLRMDCSQVADGVAE